MKSIKLFASIVLILCIAQISRSADGDKKAPDDVIKEKNLVKVGAFYLTEDDSKLAESIRQMRLAKKNLEDDSRKRIKLENEIKMAKGAVAGWEYEYRALNEKLGNVKEPFQHNQIIGQINSLVSKMKEGTTYKNERETEIAKLGNSRDAYVTVLLELSEKMEKITKDYEDLKMDDAVKGALVQINDKARPLMKLGPSAQYTDNVAFVKKERGNINSAIVKITTEGNVPHVDVTLNGKVTRSMVLDSGASFIALTADTAKSLDLNPGPNDPIIRLQLADGKLVEAKQMMLKNVRVGQFIVENVECAVMPANLVAAENLLGGTFLRNFVYKLDAAAGELHLTQVGGKPLAPDTKKPDPKAPATPDKKPAAAGEDPDMKK